jgi:putative hydrolase of HD superfamily
MKQSPSFQEIIRLSIINKLKSVYRLNSVDKRKESSAEHSWSCIVLADYILNKYKIDVDRLKVYELLMYHDLSEIHTGDFPFIPGADRGEKKIKSSWPQKSLRKNFQSNLEKNTMKYSLNLKSRKLTKADLQKQ